MKRFRLSKRANKRSFARTASATNGKNVVGRVINRTGQNFPSGK